HFVIAHANALAGELAMLGIPLAFIYAERFTDSLTALEHHCRHHGVRQIHFNEEYGINERRRDKALKHRFDELGIATCKYRDQTVAPVGEILTGQGQPYSVFTPFSRRWRSWIEAAVPTPHPAPPPQHAAIEPGRITGIPEGFKEA